jgi:hypothetical protein
MPENPRSGRNPQTRARKQATVQERRTGRTRQVTLEPVAA